MTVTQSASPPPDGLSERSRELWCAVVPKRATSAGRLALIEEALRALDRADQARDAIDREGLTFTSKGTATVHVHPLVKIERESRQLFARLWSQMGLHWSSKDDGPSQYCDVR